MQLESATWRGPVPNRTAGGNHPKLVIVHIMEGTLEGTDSWFRNPKSKVSAHFGVGKNGETYQWVATGDHAWHAVEANDHSIGIECEGKSGQALTTLQCGIVASIFRWAHSHYPDIDEWLTKQVEGSGLAWHGLGGAAWGNHPQCPGQPIVAQLHHIIKMARA